TSELAASPITRVEYQRQGRNSRLGLRFHEGNRQKWARARLPESEGQNSLQPRQSGGEGGIRTLGTGVSPYNGLANRRIRPLCHLSATILDSLPRCICGLLLPAARCFLRTDRAPRMLLRRVGLAQIHLVRAHERSMGGELICRTHLLYDRDSPVTGREKVSNPTWVKMTH